MKIDYRLLMNLKERVLKLEKEIADLKRQLDGRQQALTRTQLVSELGIKELKKEINNIMQNAELKILFRLGICNIDDQMRLGFLTYSQLDSSESQK